MNAPRDENRVTTLLGVDSTFFTTPTTVAVNPITHELLVSAAISSADEAIAYDSDVTYEYFAFAPPGSSTASAIWKAIRIDGDGQKWYADGDALYNNIATDLTALSYS